MKSSHQVTAFKLTCMLLEMGLRERSHYLGSLWVGPTFVLNTKGYIQFDGEIYMSNANVILRLLCSLVIGSSF